MADREVESSDVEVPEIPEILEKVLLFSLDEAKEKMTQGSDRSEEHTSELQSH